eukprot:3577485-Amphidinium_carterae.1
MSALESLTIEVLPCKTSWLALSVSGVDFLQGALLFILDLATAGLTLPLQGPVRIGSSSAAYGLHDFRHL